MADVEFHSEEGSGSLEGDISVPGAARTDDELSTLDEPVRETIMRDVKAVGFKFYHVLYPKKSQMLLKQWDLWGPLILCTFMAMMLQGSTDEGNDRKTNDGKTNDGGPQFAEVFVIYWVGASVVTLNSKLLGGSISFFQSVCVLGYCVCPLAISLIVCRIILAAATQNIALFVIRFLFVAAGFAWSTFASTAFLGDSQPRGRKILAMYPLFLFYFVISWLIISHTHS
ncbi:protein YIPF6-like [Littorina saxatilis]|uniref:Protein YIPF n=1 Tax=Littorina saxatilis TaxID=31220 RepID=A0AAN9G6Q2_9CAEN